MLRGVNPPDGAGEVAGPPSPGLSVPASPQELAAALEATGYLADEGLATAAYLAMRMPRPLFCEGDPGTGKTALAQALAEATGAELIRLQCHDGIDASQALYDWDSPPPAAVPAHDRGRGRRVR